MKKVLECFLVLPLLLHLLWYFFYQITRDVSLSRYNFFDFVPFASVSIRTHFQTTRHPPALEILETGDCKSFLPPVR